MRILLGEKFRVRPGTLGKPSENSKPDFQVGTVISVYPRHGFALLQFDTFKESFSFYGKDGLHNSERVTSRRAKNA